MHTCYNKMPPEAVFELSIPSSEVNSASWNNMKAEANIPIKKQH